MSMSFTAKILIAMGAGIVVGVVLSLFAPDVEPITAAQPILHFLVNGVFQVVGQIFIRVLQMMVVPLVLVSLVCGVASLGDVRALGRLGAKTLGLYLVTTGVAVTLSLLLAAFVAPGRGFDLAAEVAYEGRTAPSLAEVLINMFPANPIQALAEGQMLQIIVFALLLGVALTLTGSVGRRITKLFEDLNEVIMQMVLLIIRTAPIGVFALIARTFATQGLEVFRPLAGYFLVVVCALILHVLITYTTLLRLAGLSPLRFLGKIRTVMTFAFSTSSSSATIPVTLETLEKRLGVPNSVAAFTVPLGATINMDGTAIMQGVATVFIANVYGIDLAPADFLTVVLTATLASIGTAAVPSAGLIMLAMVLNQVGLPVEGIGLIIGVDRLLDMLRTAVNVTGDSAVSCFVARTEGALDTTVYDDPGATIEKAPKHAGERAEQRG
jgi:Na+/H+-dicarboxylate symporter